MVNSTDQRKKVGAVLKAKRAKLGIKIGVFSKDNDLRHEVIKAIEEGTSGYTVDKLNTYLEGVKIDLAHVLRDI